MGAIGIMVISGYGRLGRSHAQKKESINRRPQKKKEFCFALLMLLLQLQTTNDDSSRFGEQTQLRYATRKMQCSARVSLANISSPEEDIYPESERATPRGSWRASANPFSDLKMKASREVLHWHHRVGEALWTHVLLYR